MSAYFTHDAHDDDDDDGNTRDTNARSNVSPSNARSSAFAARASSSRATSRSGDAFDFPRARHILWHDATRFGLETLTVKARMFTPVVAITGACVGAIEEVVRARANGVASLRAEASASASEIRAIEAIVRDSTDGVAIGDIELTCVTHHDVRDGEDVGDALRARASASETFALNELKRANASAAPLRPSLFWPTKCAAMVVHDERSMKTNVRCVFAIDVAACAFELKPIYAPRVAPSKRAPEDANARATGFLTLDRTRRAIFLDERACGCDDEPLVGVWVSGVADVVDVFVWAACLRFASAERLRTLTQRGKYLLAIVRGSHAASEFYEVTASHESTPFVRYGVDVIAQPGKDVVARSAPMVQGIEPQYFAVDPEQDDAEAYGDGGEDFEGDEGIDGDHPTEEEYEDEDEYSDEEGVGEYSDEEDEDEDSDDERSSARGAQMEFLQREIDSLREAIASASRADEGYVDDDYDDDEGEEGSYNEEELEYAIRRRHDGELFDDENEYENFNRETEVSVSDSVRLLAEEVVDHVRRSKLESGASPARFSPEEEEEEEEEEGRAARLAFAAETNRAAWKLRRPDELAIDRDSDLRAQLRMEYGDVRREPLDPAEAAKEFFPKIKYDASGGDRGADGADDDEIIAKYIAKYGERALLGAA